MVTRLSFQQWGQVILYIWLIIFLGGITPFVYLNQLSVHQGIQGYQIGFAASTIRPLPQQLIENLTGRSWFNSTIHPQTYQRALPSSVQQFQAETGSIILITQQILIAMLLVVGVLTAMVLCNYSAWLAPPDKPPCLFNKYSTKI